MATEAIKSAAITSLDAKPPVRTTSGRGSSGVLHFVDGTAVFANAMTLGSTYAMVRIPSTAVVKRIWACIDTAVTTFTVDIGLSYGTGEDVSAANRGVVIDADFFGSAVALATIVVPTQYTMESAVITVPDMLLPIWNAVGLSSDPGGTFDIVLTNTATNDTTSTAYLACEYVMPGV